MYFSILASLFGNTPTELLVELSAESNKISWLVLFSVSSTLLMSYYILFSIREKVKLLKSIACIKEDLSEIKERFYVSQSNISLIWDSINYLKQQNQQRDR